MRHDVLDCSSACLLCSHVTLAAPVMCLAAFRSYQLSHVSVTVYGCVWCHMSSTQPKYGVQALAAQHNEVRDSLQAVAVAKDSVTRKLERNQRHGRHHQREAPLHSLSPCPCFCLYLRLILSASGVSCHFQGSQSFSINVSSQDVLA